tara:strand:- start:565 stop:672 length:108 start_codon:yes stop_codon:yes gene_type:complete
MSNQTSQTHKRQEDNIQWLNELIKHELKEMEEVYE